MEIGNEISFTYKGGRKVRGIITRLTDNTIIIKLLCDYIGKNDEWFEGETKAFNRNEMKDKTIYSCFKNKDK